MNLKIIAGILICILPNINLKAQSNSDSKKIGKGYTVFGTQEEHLNNFKGLIYFLPQNTSRLPNFNKLTPVGEIYTNILNVRNQDFNLGFPGVTNRFENFGIDYKGKFYIDDSCCYCFLLGSDDGAKLFIDDNLIIDNDFQHEYTPKYNCVDISKGLHEIEVQYYQGPRYSVGLVLAYKKINDKGYQVFNLAKFYPISVADNDTSIDISIGDEILFEVDSYNLSEKAKHVLNEIQRILIAKTKIKSIVIEGHTDDLGSEEYNLALSINRANAVKSFLIQNSVDPSYFVIKGYGETKPKFPNNTDENRKKNRRIEMSIVKME